MTLLLRQIRVLVEKDLYLLFNPKSRITTLWRAVWIPLIFAMYMSFILKVYWPKEQYGIGSPTQVRSLADAMHQTTGGRDTFVMVNAVNSGGDIDKVIQLIAQPLKSTGKTIKITDNVIDMIQTCQSSLQGTTKCYSAVVFNSSPKEGPWGLWNYTIRSDASFGVNVDMTKTTNDVEIYQIPLQHAIDAAIASVNSTGDAVALAPVDEYRMYPNHFNLTQLISSSFYIRDPASMEERHHGLHPERNLRLHLHRLVHRIRRCHVSACRIDGQGARVWNV
jgi:ATP-binding cassette subfamily A (ABC1) protein 3